MSYLLPFRLARHLHGPHSIPLMAYVINYRGSSFTELSDSSFSLINVQCVLQKVFKKLNSKTK